MSTDNKKKNTKAPLFFSVLSLLIFFSFIIKPTTQNSDTKQTDNVNSAQQSSDANLNNVSKPSEDISSQSDKLKESELQAQAAQKTAADAQAIADKSAADAQRLYGQSQADYQAAQNQIAQQQSNYQSLVAQQQSQMNQLNSTRPAPDCSSYNQTADNLYSQIRHYNQLISQSNSALQQASSSSTPMSSGYAAQQQAYMYANMRASMEANTNALNQLLSQLNALEASNRDCMLLYLQR